MDKQNTKIFLTEFDKEKMIKSIRSRLNIGLYGKGFLHAGVLTSLLFLAVALGWSTADARPSALDLAAQKNSRFYEKMDELKHKINQVESIMVDIESMAAEIQSEAHEVNKVIRSEVMLLPEDKKTKTKEQSGLSIPVKVTTYNAEVSQTDNTPCHAGGTRLDICALVDAGIRPIAVSQDLARWSMIGDQYGAPFAAGDVVVLKSTDHPGDPRCNGEFVVADAMNIRHRKRLDLFMPTRGQNIGCEGIVSPAGRNILADLSWAILN